MPQLEADLEPLLEHCSAQDQSNFLPKTFIKDFNSKLAQKVTSLFQFYLPAIQGSTNSPSPSLKLSDFDQDC